MNWIDIASIVFICTTANHLGLVKAIEGTLRIKLPIINCPRCLTFWSVIVYGVVEANSSFFILHSSLKLLAISFLASYSAIWLELLEGYIDTLYLKLYEKIYPDDDTDTPAADSYNGNSASTVS